MTFQTEKIDTFLELFERTKDQIRNFEGCEHLELWQDTKDERIFFTYSHWQGNEYLQKYRESDLFKQTWKETKALFEENPKAWSVRVKSIND